MTIVPVILLGIAGLLLSSFFSGTETGFYRVSRIRVQLDAIEGNRFAQWLLYLFNRPSLFIATILLGNNIANYTVSMASVILVQAALTSTGNSAEILATLILTPFLFVYGEMFPKYVFMQTPEQAFRYALPLFFVFLVLLLPISLVIWLFNRGLAFALGEKHEPLQKRLVRRELAKRFDEGQEHGIILSSQRQLTRNVFHVASQSILHYMTPIQHYPVITLAMPPGEMLAVAQQYELAEFPVFSELNPEQPVGYAHTIELALILSAGPQSFNTIEPPLRELIKIDDAHSPLNAMLLFQAGDESLASVIDKNDNILGLISEKRLMSILFPGKSFLFPCIPVRHSSSRRCENNDPD